MPQRAARLRDFADRAALGDALDPEDQGLADGLIGELPGLPERARAWLGGHARRQALVVDAVHRLYPEVLDREALVETRLRCTGC